MVEKFQLSGSVEDEIREKYSRSCPSQKIIYLIYESVVEKPKMFIRRYSKEICVKSELSIL